MMTSNRFKLKFKVIVSLSILFKYLYVIETIYLLLDYRKDEVFFSFQFNTICNCKSVFQQKQSWLVLKLKIFFQVIQKNN